MAEPSTSERSAEERLQAVRAARFQHPIASTQERFACATCASAEPLGTEPIVRWCTRLAVVVPISGTCPQHEPARRGRAPARLTQAKDAHG